MQTKPSQIRAPREGNQENTWNKTDFSDPHLVHPPDSQNFQYTPKKASRRMQETARSNGT